MKKKLFYAAFLFCLCAVHSRSQFNDGWYLYDFSKSIRATETEHQIFMSSGIRYRQEQFFTYTGVIVYIQNNSFFDPIEQLSIVIENDGKLTSPENTFLSGAIASDSSETIFWSAVNDSAGGLYNISVTGTLKPVTTTMHSDSRYDGVYALKDDGSGRLLAVTVKNGFYTWKFADSRAEDSPLNPFPVLVRPDGSINFKLTIETIAEMPGISRTVFSTSHISEGSVQISADKKTKKLLMNNFTETAGAGVNVSRSTPQIYAGLRISEGVTPDFEPPSDALVVLTPSTKQKKPSETQKKEKIPVWYDVKKTDPEKFFGFGKKQFSDPTVALELAAAAASSAMAFKIQCTVNYSQEFLEDRSSVKKNDDAFSITSEQLSGVDLPFIVTNSWYDKESSTAWVQTEISKTLLKSFIQNR